MYDYSPEHRAWKQQYRGGRYYRRHRVGWPAILLGGLFLVFLAGPIFGIVLFFLKVAFALLPFVIVGGLIAFGVRALLRGHGMNDWHSLRDDFRERFHDEAKHWKDYRYYRPSRQSDGTVEVADDSQDDEIYHI